MSSISVDLSAVGYPGKRFKIPITMATPLSKVRDDVCTKFKMDPLKYVLKKERALIDLSLPFRLSNLPANCRLDLVPSSAGAVQRVKIALDVEIPGRGRSERVVREFKTTATLWDLLKGAEDGFGPGTLTAAQSPSGMYMQPVLTVMNRRAEGQLHLTTLQSLGLSSGSVLMRLRFQETDTSLEDMLQVLEHQAAAAAIELETKAKQAEEARLLMAAKKKEEEEARLLMAAKEKEEKEARLLAAAKEREEGEARMLTAAKRREEEVAQLLMVAKRREEEAARLLRAAKKGEEEAAAILKANEPESARKTSSTPAISEKLSSMSPEIPAQPPVQNRTLPRTAAVSSAPNSDVKETLPVVAKPEKVVLAWDSSSAPSKEENTSAPRRGSGMRIDWSSGDGGEAANGISSENSNRRGYKPSPESERNPRVFRPSESQVDISRIVIPDAFYKFNESDLRGQLADSARRAREEGNTVLKTQKMRDRENEQKRQRFRNCLVRIRLPDRGCLQATFRPTDGISLVYSFVRSVLRSEGTNFHLYDTPPVRRLSESDESLWNLGLVPAALLYFAFDDDPPPSDQSVAALLNDDALAIIEDLPSADLMDTTDIASIPESAPVAEALSPNDIPPGLAMDEERRERQRMEHLMTQGLNQSSTNLEEKKMPKWFKPQ